MPDLIRIRFLRTLPGPGLHADAGEERTAHRADGEPLIAAGAAELVADPWPLAPAVETPRSPRARKR